MVILSVVVSPLVSLEKPPSSCTHRKSGGSSVSLSRFDNAETCLPCKFHVHATNSLISLLLLVLPWG